MSLNKFLKLKHMSRHTKLRISNSNVNSIMLYGNETLHASSMCTRGMQVFVNKCLRRILQIKWTAVISNESVWIKQRPIGQEIGKGR